jgi:hypothetical protein
MQKIKLLLFLCFSFLGQAVFSQNVGTISISPLQVTPGSSDECFFTVSLKNSDIIYAAHQIDLTIPKGLDVVLGDDSKCKVEMADNAIYHCTYGSMNIPGFGTVTYPIYSHSIECSFVSDRCLRVMAVDLGGHDFTVASGPLFKVYVKASPYLKPGDVPVQVSGILTENRKNSDESYTAITHTPEAYTSTSIQADATSTIALKVSATNKFGTCILPFDAELPVDGSLEAYTSTIHTSDALILTKAEKIEAFTPYILYAPEGYSATLSGTVDAAKYPAEGKVVAGNLVGTLVAEELTAGSYVMQNKGEGAMFYRVGDTPFSVGAGKCYVQFPGDVASVAMRFDTDVTGIDSVSSSSADESAPKYNIMGQRIQRPVPGHIYILDGQKYIAR